MSGLCEKIYETPLGKVHYWVCTTSQTRPWLALLPGLTADHRLFGKQLEALGRRYNCFVWDAPAHGASRPFKLAFSLDDMAQYLQNIFQAEGIRNPVLIGQSMGGYLAQVYMELFPDGAAGFISVDSCPLKREYYTAWELALLRHTYWMYRAIPWRLLLKLGIAGTSCSPYGRALMGDMMRTYTPKEYCLLADHGYRIVGQAVETNRQYRIPCPVLLLCGEKDAAGSARRYNREWARREGHELVWLEGAGHNSNTDVPEQVNRLLADFVDKLRGGRS